VSEYAGQQFVGVELETWRPVMTTTTPPIVTWYRAQSEASDLPRGPVPHDMSCACCGHGLHVHLGCGDECDCGPQIMPGTAAA
jgi:hypothetical protein